MSVELPELTPGLTVDHYQLIEQVGSGASGEVWAATYDDERRALKFMNATLLQSDAADLHRSRFASEVAALDALTTTPNIPTLYGYNLHVPRPYLAMTYIDAPSWGGLVHSGEVARLPLRHRLGLLTAIASAVAAIHNAGFLHRDLKPSNIHGLDNPTLIDFSVAVARADAADDPDVGTAIYMPPPDGYPPDDLSDNYAFGIVAYEMLFGFHPVFPPAYNPPTLHETRAEAGRRLLSGEWDQPSTLSDAKRPVALTGANLSMLDEVFSRALGPREKRYRDLADLMSDLRAAVEVEANAPYIDHIPDVVSTPEDIPADQDYTLHEVRKVQQRTQHPPPAPSRSRKHRGRRGLILTVILVALGFLALFLLVFSYQFG